MHTEVIEQDQRCSKLLPLSTAVVNAGCLSAISHQCVINHAHQIEHELGSNAGLGCTAHQLLPGTLPQALAAISPSMLTFSKASWKLPQQVSIRLLVDIW